MLPIIKHSAKFSEILMGLLNTELLCVIDDSERVIGVISRREISSYPNGSTDSTAEALCNKNYAFSTVATIESDRLKLLKYKNLPLLDEHGHLIVVLKSTTIDSGWIEAQKFELDWWRNWLATGEYIEILADGRGYTLQPYKNYIDSKEVIETMRKSTIGKICLEIGGGALGGYLPYLIDAREKIIIEPLAKNFDALRKELNIDIPGFDVKTNAVGADQFIPELQGYVNGLIICQNALDHTPMWMFVLSNIASYAAQGAIFYLWTDIDHLGFDKGHYNITNSPDKIFRMVESLGFKLLYKKVHSPFGNLNVTLVGVKE